MLILKILGALAALGLGIWLGLPGRYERSQEEVDRLLEHGGGERRWAKRHFTPLDMLRKERRGSDRRAGARGTFRTVRPERRDGR